MSVLLALLLGSVQGLTEFLPVSSSGHLRVLEALFGIHGPQTLFDVLLHVGSLTAVLFVYRDLFARMLSATVRVLRHPRALTQGLHTEADARLVLLVGVATIPTGLIGVLLGGFMEGLTGDISVVGGALVANAALLLGLGVLSRRVRALPAGGRSLDELRVRDALLIGLVQGLGIFRGISRSGSTITAGLLVGLRQDAAAAFSFLLSVPAILGALVLESNLDGATLDAPVAVAGVLSSAVVGTLALLLVLRLLDRGALHHFAWYCLAVGALAIYLGLAG